MSYRTRVTLGLTGGYLLGRFRKRRWLVAAVALVASRQLGKTVMQRGAAVVDSSPELKKLAEQGRQTAVSLAGSQIQRLTDRVHARTESLRPMPQPGAAGDREHDRDDRREPDTGGETEPGGERPGGEQEQAAEHEQRPEQVSGAGQEPQGEKAPAAEQEQAAERKREPAGEKKPAESPARRTRVAGRPGTSAASRGRR